MQTRMIPSLFLFLGAYFPLALILWIQDIDQIFWRWPICHIEFETRSIYGCASLKWQNPWLSFPLLLFTGVGLLLLVWLSKKIKPKSQVEVISAKACPNNATNYVIPYIVSFIGINLDGDVGPLIGAGVLFVFLFLILHFSGEVLMNPILIILGWRVYEIEGMVDGNLRQFVAISRERVKSGVRMKSRMIQEILILY